MQWSFLGTVRSMRMSTLLGLFLLRPYWIVPSWATPIAAKGSILLAAINLILLPPFNGLTVLAAFLAKRGLQSN